MSDAAQWHLAQYNIARLVAPLDDERLKDFVANLERVNTLGDRSPGFIWRLKTEDGTSTSIRVRDDPLILVNFTVWESIEALFEFTYRSDHAEVYRRRREWFEHPSEAYAALWWIPARHIPTVDEAEARLDMVRASGPTARAFTFKSRFDPQGRPIESGRRSARARTGDGGADFSRGGNNSRPPDVDAKTGAAFERRERQRRR